MAEESEDRINRLEKRIIHLDRELANLKLQFDTSEREQQTIKEYHRKIAEVKKKPRGRLP